MTQKQLLKEIQRELELLRQENKQLKLHVLKLEAKLEKYENPKNSDNSSIPPSQDPFRKTKSLRKKTKRKPGGQKGREGKKLEMSSTPDKVILHDISNCGCCGHSLPKESEEYDARQIFDGYSGANCTGDSCFKLYTLFLGKVNRDSGAKWTVYDDDFKVY